MSQQQQEYVEHLNFREIKGPSSTHRIFIKKESKDNEFTLSSWISKFWPKSQESKSECVDDNWKTIHCITSKDEKMAEWQKLMPSILLKKTPILLPTLERVDDLAYIAAYRVFKAFKKIKQPCMIEETSLNVQIDEYKGDYPGHCYRQVVEEMMGKQVFAQLYNGRNAITKTAFAYCENEELVHVFEGSCKGYIHYDFKNWIECDGWDSFFYPHGYNKSLAQLSTMKHIINMRHFPLAELLSLLRQKFFGGVYELHITCKNTSDTTIPNPLIPSSNHIANFRSVCQEMGIKPLVVRLDSKDKPWQLQTAAYHCFDNYETARAFAFETAKSLDQKGFPPIRIRIEAMLHNSECPKTDHEAFMAEPSCYFELHARLQEFDLKTNMSSLVHILKVMSTKNEGKHHQGSFEFSYSSVGDGSRIFVNMRSFKIGAISTLSRWNQFLEMLELAEFKVAKQVKPEFCVFDSKPYMDKITIQE